MISIAPLGEVHEVRGEVFPVMVMRGFILGTVKLLETVHPFEEEETVTE
jgi:hypothetical protein